MGCGIHCFDLTPVNGDAGVYSKIGEKWFSPSGGIILTGSLLTELNGMTDTELGLLEALCTTPFNFLQTECLKTVTRTWTYVSGSSQYTPSNITPKGDAVPEEPDYSAFNQLISANMNSGNRVSSPLTITTGTKTVWLNSLMGLLLATDNTASTYSVNSVTGLGFTIDVLAETPCQFYGEIVVKNSTTGETITLYPSSVLEEIKYTRIYRYSESGLLDIEIFLDSDDLEVTEPADLVPCSYTYAVPEGNEVYTNCGSNNCSISVDSAGNILGRYDVVRKNGTIVYYEYSTLNTVDPTANPLHVGFIPCSSSDMTTKSQFTVTNETSAVTVSAPYKHVAVTTFSTDVVINGALLPANISWQLPKEKNHLYDVDVVISAGTNYLLTVVT